MKCSKLSLHIFLGQVMVPEVCGVSDNAAGSSKEATGECVKSPFRDGREPPVGF